MILKLRNSQVAMLEKQNEDFSQDVSACNDLSFENDNDSSFSSAEGLEQRSCPEEELKQMRLLDRLSTGICVLDLRRRVVLCNRHFLDFCDKPMAEGQSFYQLLGKNDFLGPDFCPLTTVFKTGKCASTRIRFPDNRYYELMASPVWNPDTGKLIRYVVELRDITAITRVDETLSKLQNVGSLLTDITAEELQNMSRSDRIDLLRSRIETCMRDLLSYQSVEFRLLNPKTNELELFLIFGMTDEVDQRRIYAKPENNGIAGYVAYHKVFYYCEDTANDPIYLKGALNASSSVTFPLLYHNTLLGTCNIESPKPDAFDERDIFFLQSFIKDIAVAVHTLDLLSVESDAAISNSIQIVHGSITPLLDEIIQFSSILMDDYGEQIPQAKDLLAKILGHARGIRATINHVKSELVEDVDLTALADRPLLLGRRILIIDPDPQVRQNAHLLLERCGCIVETVDGPLTALKMINTSHYDCIISDRLEVSEMTGNQLLLRLKDKWPTRENIPLILTNELGNYDKGHILTEAKKNGLLSKTVGKPFIPKLLYNEIEKIISLCGDRDESGAILPPGQDVISSDETIVSSSGRTTSPVSESNFYVNHATVFNEMVNGLHFYEEKKKNDDQASDTTSPNVDDT